MSTVQGSVVGGALLITGSCIGAGMLALPVLTGFSGFFPYIFLAAVAWAFMLVSALFMVEVIGWFNQPVNLISMIGKTLGSFGKILCWCLYLFLFYALLVAYISASGTHFSSYISYLISGAIPVWVGSCFFVCLFGWVVYFGTGVVDHVNRYLMVGKIVAFIVFVAIGVRYIQPRLLLYVDLKYTWYPLPILIISFGFHNMVPILMQYMAMDRRRVRLSIYLGSGLTFFIYLVWQTVALGVLPIGNILYSFHHGVDAAQAIQVYLKTSLLGYVSQGLAFFAILTSFLAQSLSLVHFLTDGFQLTHRSREYVWICAITMIPPLLFATIFPQIFFQALNFAGGICAVVLFGIFPSLMIWIGRYRDNQLLHDRVPGGKGLLVIMMVVGSCIFLDQFARMLKLGIAIPHG